MSNYVVTFASRAPSNHGMLAGLRRMTLEEAYSVHNMGRLIPKFGRIVNAETLEVVR